MHAATPLSITALRRQLFLVTKQIAKTGTPVEFEANQQVYIVQLKGPTASKLNWLKEHPLFQSQKDIVKSQGYEWTEASKIHTS